MLFDHPVTRVPSLQFLLSEVTCRRVDDNKKRNIKVVEKLTVLSVHDGMGVWDLCVCVC